MATTSATGSGTSAQLQALVDTVNNKTTKASTATSEAQDRFLKLLTTQLKNQDPLNPLDNAQMTSQLAQISTVDGITKLNDTLQQMLSGSVDTQAMQAAALVGKSVMVTGSGITLTDSGGVAGLQLTSPADQVTATIKDANGLVVKTLSLGALSAGIHDFAWDGSSDSGTKAANGSYTITLAAKQGGDKVDASGLQLAQVQSVSRTSAGSFTMDLGTLGQLSVADIKQLF